MNNDTESNSRSKVGNALSWTLKTIIRLVLAALLLLGLSAVIWFGWQQVDQWMDSTRRRVVVLEADTEFLMENEANINEQISSLSTRIALQEANSAENEAQINQQSEAAEEFFLRVDDLVIASGEISDTVELFGGGLVSLQGDVNENIGRIDAQGGQVDALAGQIDTFSSSVAVVETQLSDLEDLVNEPDEDVVRLREALAWFRLWEMIARARLRLVENNPGLAAEEVERVLEAVSAANTDLLEDGEERAAALISRLELAGENLPDDSLAAARDLESAWEIVDEILLEIISLEISR